ncbi:hypothetical protein K450DRAFT_278947 [Umbelopsis ramanniana AG]|uniref:LysM domain-containing protein n=1 Tax=Umbelopsis ramanniana AG TaxID=1314678 RepID=A0AAD5EDV0_UMBRA|nr:uncharacterized protein K450DRAFT_278947 [Umbelopsis ramanniana AG]KAI8581502.1 hypothetical protein K450DRAFT_278947 [Umbelopsis ramanniana AG]
MTRRHIPCVDHPLSPDATESIPPPHILVSQNSTPEITLSKWTHAYRRKYPHQPLRRNSDDSIFVQAIIHKVKKNDTVAGIGLFYGIPLSKLKKANRLWTNDSIHARRILYIPLKDCLSLTDYTIDKEAQTITFYKALPNVPLHHTQSPFPNDATWRHIMKVPLDVDDDSHTLPAPAHDRSRLPSFGIPYSDDPSYQETGSESSFGSSSDSSSFTRSQLSNGTQSPTLSSFHIVECTADLVNVKASELSFFAPPQHQQASSCPSTPPLNLYSSSSPPLSAYQPLNGHAKSWMDGIRTSLESLRSPSDTTNEHKLTVFSINGQPEKKDVEWR